MSRTKRRIKLGYHIDTGQFRKFIKGKMYYFGADEKTALARYSFSLETDLSRSPGIVNSAVSITLGSSPSDAPSKRHGETSRRQRPISQRRSPRPDR